MGSPQKYYFSGTDLYNGYLGRDMTGAYTERCYMRVFGDGNMVLPYEGHDSINSVITASSDGGSTISPSGDTSVALGGSQTYAISVNSGYHLLYVVVDGEDEGPISSYTFSNVWGHHTISVVSESNSAYHTVTVQSVDDGTNWVVPTNVYVGGNYVGSISDGNGASFSVQYGSQVTVGVDDPVPIPGYYDMYWFFQYFDGGSGGNPTTVTITWDTTITAHYLNGYG